MAPRSAGSTPHGSRNSEYLLYKQSLWAHNLLEVTGGHWGLCGEYTGVFILQYTQEQRPLRTGRAKGRKMRS